MRLTQKLQLQQANLQFNLKLLEKTSKLNTQFIFYKKYLKKMSLSETKPHTKKLYKQQDKQTTSYNKTNKFMTEFNFAKMGGVEYYSAS
jgi:ATP/maltotriose-dependent transcriptional regulator MalT